MIAAVRRRKGRGRRKISALLVRWTRRADRVANRALERAHPMVLRASRLAGAGFDAAVARVAAPLRWLGRRLRPVAALLLAGLGRLERLTHLLVATATRAATAASAVVTPRRAGGAAIAIAGALLVASQFIDYRAVEIGQPGYAGLPAAADPPTREARSAGEAHAYLLVPVGLAAVALGIGCGRSERRRLGLAAAALGLVAIVVALAVDLPAGLDLGTASTRFAGASAVLEQGFYAELAAAAGLVLSGLLYYARPCRIRISLSGRAASGRRRRPRRRASSRARVARSA